MGSVLIIVFEIVTLTMRMFYIALVLLLLACTSASAGEPLQPIGSVEFSGGLKAGTDVSGIALLGTRLVAGVDEAIGEESDENAVQLMHYEQDNVYSVYKEILLFRGDEENGEEMDIEGIATEGEMIYVVGSHSAQRRRIKASKKYKKNRKSLHESKISPELNRAWLYRLQMGVGDELIDKSRISLRKIIADDLVLKNFYGVPGKENGVDIEGIAAARDSLYLGFRGPVFRSNWVPVMRLDFENRQDYVLLYLNLGGRGIRGMASVADGFLLIAGPVGDGPESYELYHWDGKDMIPGKDRESADLGHLSLLGEINPPQRVDTRARAKAEGVVVLAEHETSYDLILVFDSAANGGAQRFRVPKAH